MFLNLAFSLIGGFGLFMYGLKVFSDGLQESTENALKEILHKLTQNKIFGIALGFLITAIVQSSSAVTVMTVSFVNANILTLSQAINIILGANIGTTVTGWIISLNIDVLALPSLGIGSIIVIFGSENRKLRFFGEILMGFGMIFYGLILMKMAFEGVRGSEDFEKVFLMANANTIYGRFLCVMIGMIVTAIIQSSSAALGVTISLASVGLIDYPTGVALILGQNIGTTITAVLATLGASTNAKRAALVHCLFNIFGVIYMFFLFPYYIKLVDIVVGLMNIGDPNLVVNNKYVLYIVQSSSDSNLVLEQYDTKEIIWGTRPSESPQLNTIYVDNSIGYIWDGTKWIEIFKDISSKADLESPNFTGTPTIDTKPIATQEWVTENLQNTLDVKIGNLGEYETVKDYIDSKYSESEVSINDLQAAVTECKEYTNNLLQIVEF